MIQLKMKRKPKGIVTVLVPGGALEARNWSKNEIKLYLQKRKGFIKLAMRHGIDLVPTFSFNEQFIYRQLVSDTGKVSVLLYDEHGIRRLVMKMCN